MISKLFFLFFMLVSLGSCRSGSIQSSTANNTNLEKSTLLEFKAIPVESTSYRAQYSPDQKRIIFISRDRMKHNHPQVYEYNFEQKVERRITYQDGEIHDVIYNKNGLSIFYSSTTDEIKERPNINKMLEGSALNTDVLPPTEIYESQLDGMHIRRLTDSPLFDGAVSLHRLSNEIAYISMRRSKPQLMIMNPITRSSQALGGSHADVTSVAYSYDGKSLMWTKLTAPATASTTEIWIGNKSAQMAQALPLPAGIYNDVAWHPNGEEIVFSYAPAQAQAATNKPNFEIYVAKKDGSCLTPITNHSADDRWPSISPDGKKLLFSSLRSGRWQIYEAIYYSAQCPATTNSTTPSNK